MATAGGRTDPYFLYKDKIQRSVTKLLNNYEEWKDLFESSNTATSTEFTHLNADIKSNVRKLNVKLSDLQKTITVVESNRAKFPQISDDELRARQKFISDMRDAVNECANTLESDETHEKLRKDKANSRRIAPSESGLEKIARQENEYFMGSHEQKQMFQEKEQDVVLDDMVSSLKRLGVIGSTIQVELKEQNELLVEVEEDLDATQEHMNVVMRKLDKLIDTKDTKKLCLIFVLVIVLVVMCYIAFS